MIIGFPLHIVTALRCAQINESARPTPYAYANKAPARTAALTMLLSGGTVLAFFAYHIAHFTLRAVGPMPTELLSTGDWNAAQMVVLGFQNPLISGFYIVGQLLLAMHLSHGLYSLFQHLGFWGSKWTPFLKNRVAGGGLRPGAAFASHSRSPSTWGSSSHETRSEDSRRAHRDEVDAAQGVGARSINPANKRKFKVIVVGTGLAGASAAATLSRARLPGRGVLLPGLAPARALHRGAGRHQRGEELPERRRLGAPARLRHRQGRRLPRPRRRTCTGWPRSRRTSSTSASAQGVPFAREYGGQLSNRSFGGAQVSRTFYARGQTGQQLLLGAYRRSRSRSAPAR